jgi:PAS domain S-box-containing protein
MLALARAKNDEEDGAFVIHEVLYLPGEHEWRFPSRRNVDQLLALMSKSAVNSAAAGASASGIEKPGELHYAHHYTSGLLGAIQDPQVTVDEKFRITDINDAFCSLCHSDRLALVARPLTDLFINPEAAAGALRGCFARGKLAGAPLKLRGTKGEGIPIIFNSLVFRDRADGLVHGALICVHPVPAMVFNEVTQSRQYARDLLEASLDALMVIDRAGVISDVNEAFCQLGGQPREKLIGSNFSDLFAPKEAAQVGVVTTYRDGTVRNYELDLLDSAGGRIPVSFNATVYRDQEGVSRGIFAAARDVREHKRMIMELEEAKNYARGLIESALDLMVTIDRSGKVMDVNAAAVRLTGRTREELVGSRFADYFDDPVRAKEGVDLTFSGGAVRDYRLNLITRNGKSVQVSFNATLYKDRLGQVQGVFATARESKAQTG